MRRIDEVMKGVKRTMPRVEKRKASKTKPPQEPSAPAPAPASTAKPPVDREKLRARAVMLVARAAHETTPEEEARTSALVAAKIIHAEKFLEPSVGRHALLERLEGLEDDVLNDMAVLVEEALEAGGIARAVEKSARWRNEAKYLQRKLDTLAGALRWILQGYKLGLAESPGHCGLCQRALILGDIVVWKRRRFDAVHYVCCVAALQQQGAIPS